MTYAIQNVNGQWWAGSCWGVEEAREVYAAAVDVPPYLVSKGEELERDIHSEYEPIDVRYYDVNDPSDWPDAVAAVRVVSTNPAHSDELGEWCRDAGAVPK